MLLVQFATEKFHPSRVRVENEQTSSEVILCLCETVTKSEVIRKCIGMTEKFSGSAEEQQCCYGIKLTALAVSLYIYNTDRKMPFVPIMHHHNQRKLTSA